MSLFGSLTTATVGPISRSRAPGHVPDNIAGVLPMAVNDADEHQPMDGQASMHSAEIGSRGSRQFTKLIAAPKARTANTRVVATGDETAQEPPNTRRWGLVNPPRARLAPS